MTINNKTVLITGGSSGIGKTTAERLIKLGAKVAITGRDKEKLETVAQNLGAFPIHADIENPVDVETTVTKFLSEFGTIDVLINNAGIGVHKPLEELSIKDFKHVFGVNVFGLAMMSQKVAEVFKTKKSGTIINIGSTSGLNGYKTGSVYSSSKFAVRGLTQCLQAELRPFNIRVTLINPSEVPTAFGNNQRIERVNVPNKLSTKEVSDAIISSLQMDERGMIPELTLWATNPW